MALTQIRKDNFWESDLSDIERQFLPKGKKITDLKVGTDGRVPEQGSVLLGYTVSVDDVVPQPNLWARILYKFKH